MLIRFARVCLLVVGATVFASAAQTPPAETMFEAARKLDVVDGNLEGAIKQYEAIIASHRSDRSVQARALVKMADCYQRLGNEQATKLFERVLREFADQKPEVEVARARLGALPFAAGSPAKMVGRQLWTGAGVDTGGTVTSDGRYLSFTDWSTGNLAIRDLSRGTVRPLTPKTGWTSRDYAEESAISRDGSQIAYSWFNEKADRYDLRLVKSDASIAIPPRILLDNPDVSWIGAYDWSPDGQWVAVQLQRRDRSAQIGLVGVKDGSFKALKSTDWLGSSRLFFSPDGTHLAYDLPQEDSTNRDVFVLRIDGSRELTIAPHRALDLVAGWSPDGTSVLFSSDRAGSPGLWAATVADGHPAVPPRLLKSDLGQFMNSLGVTRSGTLAYAVRTAAAKTLVDTVDLETRARVSGPVELFENYLTPMRLPDWSPDGKRIVALIDHRRTRLLAIRSLDGSESREVRAAMSYLQRPRWASATSIFVEGVDLKGRPGIFRVDPRSGDTTAIVTARPGESVANAWPADGGATLLYRRGTTGKSAVIRHDLASGQERILVESPDTIPFSVSPDGRLVAYVLLHQNPAASSLNLMSLNDGRSRELHRVTGTVRIGPFHMWTPNGRAVMFPTVDRDKRERWMISIDSGTLRRVDPSFPVFSGSLNPDGRRVVYDSGTNSFEVWTLENFLPSGEATASRR